MIAAFASADHATAFDGFHAKKAKDAEERKKTYAPMSPEAFFSLVEKYTVRDYDFNPIDADAADFEALVASRLAAGSRDLDVTNALQTTPDGVMERPETCAQMRRALRRVYSAEMGTVYVRLIGFKTVPYPHPSILEDLEKGKYAFVPGSGFLPFGARMPEETVILQPPSDGVPIMTTVVMCSKYSNFNAFLKPMRVADYCSGTGAPAVDDAVLLGSEHGIHFFKCFMRHICPGLFNAAPSRRAVRAVLQQEGFAQSAGEKRRRSSWEAAAAFRGTDQELDAPTDLSADEVAEIAAVHEEIYLREGKFASQKALGRAALVLGRWFDLAGGSAQPKRTDFDAAVLASLGLNSLVQAAMLLLRLAAGDRDLWDLLRLDIEVGNVTVEGAMHGDIKGPARALLFGGCAPDDFWGKVCGCPRYVNRPDGLVRGDGRPCNGHLGNGIELVRSAIAGSRATVDFLRLPCERVAFEDAGRCAGAVLDLIFERIAVGAVPQVA